MLPLLFAGGGVLAITSRGKEYRKGIDKHLTLPYNYQAQLHQSAYGRRKRRERLPLWKLPG